MMVETTQEEVESLQTQQHKQRCGSSQDIPACTTGQTDGCRHPDAGSGGKATHGVLLEDNGTCSYEAYAADHLCRHARHIKTVLRADQRTTETVGRDNHEQRRTQRHQEMGAEACRLVSVFALQSYHTAQQGSYEDAQYEVNGHLVHSQRFLFRLQRYK